MPQNKREKPIIENILSYNSVILGLMGHVDSGKTAIAGILSEIISTAGLDAHPQSQDRGITIDLGFTSFISGSNLITLVDAPGHADLIRSVVASGNIIDGAILVIDGSKGIQIQTVEHLVILESLGIKGLIVVINKIDLIEKNQIEKIEDQLRKNLPSSIFEEKFPIVQVSAKNNIGFDILKGEIGKLVNSFLLKRKNVRISDGKVEEEKYVHYPIDHHLKIKGVGLVVTGTLLNGKMNVGETYIVLPQKKRIKIKSLQIFHQNVEKVGAGFRVGAGISGIEAEQLARGNVITNAPDHYIIGEIVDIDLDLNNYFKKTLEFGAQVNITTGLTTTDARIYPYYINEGKKIILDKIGDKKSSTENSMLKAYLWANNPIHFKLDERLLLSQLSLPPTMLRFFGTGIIRKTLPKDQIPELFYLKEKIGKVRDPMYGNNKILVEGLAMSKKGAESLLGKNLEFPPGKIDNTFGKKGVLIVTLDSLKIIKEKGLSSIEKGDTVSIKLYRKTKINKDKSY